MGNERIWKEKKKKIQEGKDNEHLYHRAPFIVKKLLQKGRYRFVTIDGIKHFHGLMSSGKLMVL